MQAPGHLSNKLLEITNLCLERGERLLLDSFNLDISSGQVLQVAGPNGSGKTSLLRTIAGLINPLQGKFSWCGQPVSNASVFSDELLFVGHKPAVRMQLNPVENLQYFELMQGAGKTLSPPEKIEKALSELGLAGYEEELCSRLSAGQKRRVGLARLRLTTSPLWVLDEPFTAIDAKGVDRLCGWIDEFASGGGSVIFTTHQPVKFPTNTPQVLDLADQLRNQAI